MDKVLSVCDGERVLRVAREEFRFGSWLVALHGEDGHRHMPHGPIVRDAFDRLTCVLCGASYGKEWPGV